MSISQSVGEDPIFEGDLNTILTTSAVVTNSKSIRKNYGPDDGH